MKFPFKFSHVERRINKFRQNPSDENRVVLLDLGYWVSARNQVIAVDEMDNGWLVNALNFSLRRSQAELIHLLANFALSFASPAERQYREAVSFLRGEMALDTLDFDPAYDDDSLFYAIPRAPEDLPPLPTLEGLLNEKRIVKHLYREVRNRGLTGQLTSDNVRLLNRAYPELD